MSIVSSDFVLGVLWDADASKDADDCNDNQQFDECETFCTFVSWMFDECET